MLTRSLAAALMASASIGSGVWLHGYTQPATAASSGSIAALLSRTPVASVLHINARTIKRLRLNAILNAKSGKLAQLRSALGLGRVHPSWANPAALVVVLGGLAMSVRTFFRGMMMRRRMKRVAASGATIPPELFHVLTQYGRGTDRKL